MSDLSAASKLHVVHRRLYSAKHTLKNHLLSIEYDARFVELLSSLFPSLPVIANLRNGLWYTTRKSRTCYFKSTDGHVNQWLFSSQRLNIDTAVTACRSGGCIIVDSTRRGKRFPDSMSYTIPIWCAVINHTVLDMAVSDCTFLPPWAPEGVQFSLQNRVGNILLELSSDIIQLIKSSLLGILTTPLRPIWCSVEDGMIEWSGEFSEEFVESGVGSYMGFVPLVLFSCSEDISESSHSEQHSWHYIKGAGDDEEHWSNGLTPDLFWKHKDVLLSAENSDGDVISLVREIVTAASSSSGRAEEGRTAVAGRGRPPTPIPGTSIFFCALETWTLDCVSHFDALLEVSTFPSSDISGKSKCSYFHVSCGDGAQKHNKTRDNYASCIFQSLKFYHEQIHGGKMDDRSLPKFAIISSGDRSAGLVVLFSILIAFFRKPELPASDGSAGDSNRVNSFVLWSGPFRTSRDMSKQDIKFVVSVAQMLLPDRPLLSRGLLQELTKFFLSPDQSDLRLKLGASTLASSWDKLCVVFQDDYETSTIVPTAPNTIFAPAPACSSCASACPDVSNNHLKQEERK